MKTNIKTARLVTTRHIIYEGIYKNIPRIIALILLIILATLMNVISPLLYKMLIDDAIPNMNVHRIVILLIGMVLIPVGNMGITGLQNHIRAYVGVSVEKTLREKLFEHVLKSQLYDVEQLKSGDIIYRITRSCGQVGSVYICDKLLPLLSSALLLFGYIGIMFGFCWQLSLIAFLAIPISYLLAQYFKNRAYSIDDELMNILESGQNYLQEVISGLRTVRSMNGESFEFTRWGEWLVDHMKKYIKSHVSHYAYLFSSEFINNLLIGIIYGFGAFLVVKKQITIGGLIAFVIYVPSAYSALRVIFQSQVSLGEVKAAAEKIDHLFTMNLEEQGNQKLTQISDNGMKIEFKNVSFNYGRGDFCVQNLSFSIAPGEFIGIVGKSGGGKSTIFDLIMGFYQPQTGEIIINGLNLRDLALKELRKHISLVPQDIFLWNGSIRENIMYPQKTYTPDVIEYAAKISQLEDFIKKLPQGYETVVGERGQSLSTGERQRISICRSLLQESGLLLLDEVTSALDAVTESKLREAITQIRYRKTIIAIAHRLSTVMQADRIFVLDEGKLIESGTPAELITRGGIFRDLYQAQKINQ